MVKEAHPTYRLASVIEPEEKRNGGRYWIRTSDPTDVNRVLYR